MNISITFKIPQLYEFCHHDVISSANDKELIDALFQFEGYHISFQRGFCSYLEQKRCFLFFSIQKTQMNDIGFVSYFILLLRWMYSDMVHFMCIGGFIFIHQIFYYISIVCLLPFKLQVYILMDVAVC